MASEPISKFMEEHQTALEQLDRLEKTLLGISIPPSTKSLEAVENFISFFHHDLHGIHCRKEEEVLFPALEAYIGRQGPIAVMLFEHEELHKDVAEMEEALGGLTDSAKAQDSLDALARAGLEVIYTLRSHIIKEDQVLFPIAEQTLPPAEMAEVARRCREIEAGSSTERS